KFSRSFMFYSGLDGGWGLGTGDWVGTGTSFPVPSPCSLVPSLASIVFLQLDVQTERPYFLGQDVERLRHAGLHLVLAVDNILVHARTPVHIVGLDRQHFLQRIGGAVGLQGPHFHFAETLAAELGLAAQRLLRDQRVRTGGAGMHLVVNQVVQLEDVHVANRDFAAERLAGAAVDQLRLARFRQTRQTQQFTDFVFVGTIEHRRGRRHAVNQIARQRQHFLVAEAVEILLRLV